MQTDYYKIFKILKTSEKFFLLILFGTVILCSLFEFLSISALFPLIQQIFGSFENHKFYEKLNSFLRISEFNENEKLMYIIALIVFIFFIKNLVFIANTYLTNVFAFKLRYRLLNSLYDLYLNKNYEFFQDKSSSELLRNRDTVSAIGYGAIIYLQILNNILLIFALTFISVLFINLSTLLIFTLFVILLAVYYLSLKGKIQKISKKEQKNAFEELKSFQHTFKGIKEILTSLKLEKFKKKYQKVTLKGKFMGITLSTVPELSKFIIEFLTVLILSLTIMFLYYQKNDFSTIFGTFSLIMIISLRLFPLLNKILLLSQKLNAIYGKLQIFFNEFDFNRIQKTKKPNVLKKFKRSIVIQNVSFKYNKNYKKNVLNKINLKIKKNQILGIFGSSGSGKTTLVDIILGLLKIDEGKIIIDGKVRDRYILPSNYISQFDYLFDDTIANNIAIFSRQKPNSKQINRLLSLVNLDEFVNQLPNKIHTQVGEHGKNLSGGQMQRISLIRALYSDYNIIVFDEPTSMLDQHNATSIFKNFIKILKKKKTIIYFFY